VRTSLILLGIWLLLNILFVVVMVPPYKPRRSKPTPGAGRDLAPAPVDKSAYPFEDEDTMSLRHIIASLGMGIIFLLSPFLLEGIEATKRAFRRDRS
jgi:hypothetical protein